MGIKETRECLSIVEQCLKDYESFDMLRAWHITKSRLTTHVAIHYDIESTNIGFFMNIFATEWVKAHQ